MDLNLPGSPMELTYLELVDFRWRKFRNHRGRDRVGSGKRFIFSFDYGCHCV